MIIILFLKNKSHRGYKFHNVTYSHSFIILAYSAFFHIAKQIVFIICLHIPGIIANPWGELTCSKNIIITFKILLINIIFKNLFRNIRHKNTLYCKYLALYFSKLLPRKSALIQFTQDFLQALFAQTTKTCCLLLFYFLIF